MCPNTIENNQKQKSDLSLPAIMELEHVRNEKTKKRKHKMQSQTWLPLYKGQVFVGLQLLGWRCCKVRGGGDGGWHRG